MPRRHILTERQRSALFHLPIDELSLLKHYTLADEDLEHIRERRRPENRLGFALQLSWSCAHARRIDPERSPIFDRSSTRHPG